LAFNMKISEEFIGKDLEIAYSENKQVMGLKGKIVDETKSSFKLLVGKDFKVILKKGARFIIGGTVFTGEKLLRRPEDRIKLKDE
jgi:ribonuclease P protein subunit POP4